MPTPVIPVPFRHSRPLSSFPRRRESMYHLPNYPVGKIMSSLSLQTLRGQYDRDGFVSAVEIIDPETALSHRQRLEDIESKTGPLHYKPKIHAMLTSPYELATLPRVLDVVESLLGPDILLYNTTFIIKEPHTPNLVSWHQDLTYWGFDCDDQVSMWLALSPATSKSGCMRVIPGTHKNGKRTHNFTEDENNVLYSGQTVYDVEEDKAFDACLQPGQASFHHGWTLHSSMPNQSNDRRIGLNVQYIAPHVRQIKHDQDSALLVRGTDQYSHFQNEVPARSDLTVDGIRQQAIMEERYEQIAGTA